MRTQAGATSQSSSQGLSGTRTGAERAPAPLAPAQRHVAELAGTTLGQGNRSLDGRSTDAMPAKPMSAGLSVRRAPAKGAKLGPRRVQPAEARTPRPPTKQQGRKPNGFVRDVLRDVAAVWEVRHLSARGKITGLCLPVGTAGAVRCKRLAQLPPDDRKTLLQAMHHRPASDRRTLIRDRNGVITKRCVGHSSVTGSHVRRASCEDL